MQMTGDRADFPAGTAVSGRSTADSSGINGPFTAYDALMREHEALIYHRQILERKRAELEQSLQKQRNEKEVCPALFVFPSAETLLIATQSDREPRTLGTCGITNQCVHNSAVPSSWSTPIGSGVGATGMKEYQKSFHAKNLTETLQLVKEISLCSANQVAVMRALTTAYPAPMLRRLELEVPELSEAIVHNVSQMETAGQLECVVIRLRRVTRTLQLLCSLSSLRSLDLSHTTITNEDLSGLQRCHNLVTLDISYCRGVTDLSPILHIKSLEVVKLSEFQAFIGVGALGMLPCLKELEMTDTRITDYEIRQLSQCHTLVKIDLYYCEALRNVNSLSSIATLEVIDLSRCTSLTHVGALGKLPALKEVDLCGTRITDEEVRQLSECHTLVKIDLHCCTTLTNVNPLCSVATLEEIDLSRCTSLTHVGALGRLPVLKEVNLSHTPITDEDVCQLSECSSLVKIDLHCCTALTNVNSLSTIASLEEIDLSGCTSLTRVAVTGKLPKLICLDLWSSSVMDEEVYSLTCLRQELGLPSVDVER